MSVRAVILSAGQGRRLLPLTADTPKCLLDVCGRSVLEWQIEHLARCGIERVTVVVGYGAELVERRLAERYPGGGVETLYNPFFAVSDNLATCWIARHEMTEDFLLLNGDTLFESDVLLTLLDAPERPVTVTTDRKLACDADDMKVCLEGERLLRIGKDLPIGEVDGESIGMILFRGDGPRLFRTEVERLLRRPTSLKRWYLTVIDELARRRSQVWTCSIQGLDWKEIDCHEDLEDARCMVAGWDPIHPGNRRQGPVRAEQPPSRRRVTALRVSG